MSIIAQYMSASPTITLKPCPAMDGKLFLEMCKRR